MATSLQMNSGRLPIGVVMPVLNCRLELPAHLHASASWLSSVEKVVVVDSFSADGSLDYLKANLKHPNVEFHSHPPGLYQSWNFGISRIESRYLYVSTMGDLIPAEALEALAHTADQFSADVVLSPPKLVAPSGELITHFEWPIHEMLRARPWTEPVLMNPWELFTLAAFFATAGGLKGVIGSSASNLYRTELLQKHPFPTDFNVVGDTAWGLRHFLHAKVALFPFQHSQFVVVNRPVNDAHRQRNQSLIERLEQQAIQSLQEIPQCPEKADFLKLFEEWKSYSAKRLSLEKFRKAAFPWILRPDAWLLRLQRKNHQKRFRALARKMLGQDQGPLLDFVVK